MDTRTSSTDEKKEGSLIKDILSDETAELIQIITTNSFEKLMQILKSFPFAELKIFSLIDKNYDQFSINKQGELCIVTKGIFSQLFYFFYNDPGLPPLTVIKNVLTQAKEKMKILAKYWPNETLMLALPESDKEKLRVSFETILNYLEGSLAGLCELQKIHSTNTIVTSNLEEFKNEIKLLIKKVLYKRWTIPEDDMQLDIMELIEMTVDAADIDTVEDLTFALDKCDAIIKAYDLPNEKGYIIQQKIRELKNLIEKRLAEVAPEEEQLEESIFRYKNS